MKKIISAECVAPTDTATTENTRETAEDLLKLVCQSQKDAQKYLKGEERKFVSQIFSDTINSLKKVIEDTHKKSKRGLPADMLTAVSAAFCVEFFFGGVVDSIKSAHLQGIKTSYVETLYAIKPSELFIASFNAAAYRGYQRGLTFFSVDIAKKMAADDTFSQFSASLCGVAATMPAIVIPDFYKSFLMNNASTGSEANALAVVNSMNKNWKLISHSFPPLAMRNMLTYSLFFLAQKQNSELLPKDPAIQLGANMLSMAVISTILFPTDAGKVLNTIRIGDYLTLGSLPISPATTLREFAELIRKAPLSKATKQELLEECKKGGNGPGILIEIKKANIHLGGWKSITDATKSAATDVFIHGKVPPGLVPRVTSMSFGIPLTAYTLDTFRRVYDAYSEGSLTPQSVYNDMVSITSQAKEPASRLLGHYTLTMDPFS